MMKRSGITQKLHIRLMCLLLALVMAIGILPVQRAAAETASEENILYNGSFDLVGANTQTVPGWSLNPSNSNHTVTVQTAVTYDGQGRALQIDATGVSYIYTADFAVESGATYILSYYMRVDSAEGLRYAPFMNDSNYKGGWWLDYAVQAVTSVTDGWQKVYGMVTIPESVGANANNPESKVQLGFKVYGGQGSFYLDEVSVVKSQINQDDPNLDFEAADPQSGTPANWKTTASAVAIESDSSAYHDGSRSMYVRKTSLEEKSTIRSEVHLPVDSRYIYEFSFWMCARNAAPTATVRMNLLAYGADGTPLTDENGSQLVTYGTVATLHSGSERSGWTKVVTRAAPPEGAAYVSVCFVITRGEAELWIDDLFLNVVEDGTDCLILYEDFHAMDDGGNVGSWKQEENANFTCENGGQLTVTEGTGAVYNELQCLTAGNTYCLKGTYSANAGGTVQMRFYDYTHKEDESARQTVPLNAGGTAFTLHFTAPGHTYAAIYIGLDQAGTLTLTSLSVYQTAEKPKADRNYLDADWTSRADRENVHSAVELYNGVPTLMIDGVPTAPHFYLRPDLEEYLKTDAESRIAQSGLELYVTYGGSLYKGGCAPVWLADGTLDYAAFDQVIYDTLAANENALVMVHIGMFAPKWWLEQNPDHVATAHNGVQAIPLSDVSLASEKFRREAGEVLRQLIAHMKQQNYYNRVFGLKLSGGQSYEWMHLGTGAQQGPDYSAVSQAGFREYLKRKYGTDQALQQAWGNTQVTLETASAPGWDEKCASSNVYVGDLTAGTLSRNIVDWNLWLGEASADSFLYYCQIAKEETDGKLIVGGYNGYLWTSNSYDSHGMAHTAVDRVLDSEYVDWISSPVAYNERLLGESSTYMALLDTVQAHGKLYIAEQDNRTCLADSYAGSSWDAVWDYKVGQTRTMADTIYQQKRDFANALVNGAGLWQFDMYGGWLDDSQIYSYLQDAKAEYDVAVHLDRTVTNEIAVFVGDETYGYLTAENGNMSFTLLEPMLQQQRKHLASMGAGYDTYTISTLLEGKVPAHKLNIVLSPFEITEQMHDAMDAYLKTNEQVVVWVYLPGISTGTELSLQNVKRATGFTVGATEKKSTLQVQLASTDHCLTAGLEGLVYGNSVKNSVSPLTYIADSANCTVLGYNADGGLPGLAVKDMGTWTSVYSAAPCLDVRLLKNLMEFAGCHSYTDSAADVIYSSDRYVALHSATAGVKTVHLPARYSVYDVFEKRVVGMDTDVITFEHLQNDTHLFRLMEPNCYAVTASITGGKGSLSAPGLTQVQAGRGYSVKILPETGYVLSQVTVNGEPASVDGEGVLRIGQVTNHTDIKVRFEKQQLLDNWDLEYGDFGGSVTGKGAVTVMTDSTVYRGVYSLRLNNDGTARDLAELTIYMDPSTADRTLTVSYRAKTAAGAVGALHTGAHFFSGTWSRTQASVYDAVYPGKTSWKLYTQELTLPAGTEIFQYQLYADTANADVYVDNISVTCDGKQMMVNGGLERGNLTGSFTKTENTPTVARSQVVHSGRYAAYLRKGGVLTAQTAALSLEKPARVALSAWVMGLSGSVTYHIYRGETLLAEGTWTDAAQWSLQTAVCDVPAGDGALKVTLATDGMYYVDDLDLSLLPAETETADAIRVKTWNLSLGGDLTVHFYGEIGVSYPEKAEAVISVGDATYTFEATQDLYDSTQEAYRFSVPVAAAQMNEELCVTLLYDGVQQWEKTYTVQEYAHQVLADPTLSTYHEMVREMLNYGGMAQLYFDYRGDCPVNAELTGVGTKELPEAEEQDVIVQGTVEGLNFYGASLLFRERVAVRYYFVAPRGAQGYTFTMGDETFEAVEQGAQCYVELPGINPQDWDEILELTVTDETGSQMTVCYRPMQYMLRMNSKGSDSLRALLKAMYNYHLAAKTLTAQ